MNGLNSKEWDMILGGLEAFRANEEVWLNDNRKSVVEDTEKTIEMLDKLYARIETNYREARRKEDKEAGLIK
jgi:hypothetical protein